MKIEKYTKPSFSVIGKEGSTRDGSGFIGRLWEDANSHFDEIRHLVKRDAGGNLVGIWGAMSDFSRSFLPWENNFSEGLYLAGAECEDDAQPPEGWVKWTVPGYEYLVAACETENTFPEMIRYLSENNIPLVGAVQDFTCPATGENRMFFPIKYLCTFAVRHHS